MPLITQIVNNDGYQRKFVPDWRDTSGRRFRLGGGLVSLGIFSSKGGWLMVDSPLSGLKDRQR